MTLCLRLEPVTRAVLDRELAELTRVDLVRCDAGLFLECAASDIDLAICAVARAGLRAVRDDVVPRDGLMAAIVGDLEPRSVSRIVDRVSIRSLDLADAIAHTLPRRRLRLRRPGPGSIDHTRDLLHGTDRVFCWRRVVWAERSLLRSGALGSVRPVVFDRDAVKAGPFRTDRASAGLVARWALR